MSTELQEGYIMIYHWLFENKKIIIVKKMSSNIARGDISRAGIIFVKDLQVRVLLERGYYSREGLI